MEETIIKPEEIEQPPRVCANCFPNRPEGFYQNRRLTANLNELVKAITNDFDFVILVSGSGRVRIGKSIIAMETGYYLNHQMNVTHGIKNSFDMRNFVFRGEELIARAKTLKPYSVLIFDEAGADLVGRKTMLSTTQAVLDFFREVGQLNLFLILVLPDFFDLPKSIAITRSVCLIDVDFKEKFNRGLFRFYGERQKKELYIRGKKMLDYNAARCDFFGNFTNFYTVDEEEYRKAKLVALLGRKRAEEDLRDSKKEQLWRGRFILLIKKLVKEFDFTLTKIAEMVGMHQTSLSSMTEDKKDKGEENIL
jgi:hypothetical protein